MDTEPGLRPFSGQDSPARGGEAELCRRIDKLLNIKSEKEDEDYVTITFAQ